MSFGQTASEAALEQLFERIESHETATSLNVVSSVSGFLRASGSEEAVLRLIQRLRAEEMAASAVLLRLMHLVDLQIDHRYENPNDVAMAIYVQALSVADPVFYGAATEVVANARNCWWTRRVLEKRESLAASANDSSVTELRKTEGVGFAIAFADTTSFDSTEINLTGYFPVFADVGVITPPSGFAFTPDAYVFSEDIRDDLATAVLWPSRVNSPTINSALKLAA